MIIYNVTISIDESIEKQWLDWIQEKHMQDVLDTGKFTEARLVKVLIDPKQGGVTYSVQYTANTMSDLQAYYEEDAERLRKEGLVLFADKMLAFRTELKVLKVIKK